MRTFFWLLIILFGLNANKLSAQSFGVDVSYTTNIPNAEKQLIFYSPKKMLDIDDFKGAPVDGSDVVAITTSGFAFKAGYRNEGGKATLVIAVYCTFDQQLSWMKANGKNPYVLSHEQHHFDISYIAAKSFVAALKAAEFTKENYKSIIENNYATAIANLEKMQEQYDSETQNGQLKDIQANWSKRLQQQVK